MDNSRDRKEIIHMYVKFSSVNLVFTKAPDLLLGPTFIYLDTVSECENNYWRTYGTRNEI